jgi:hypothetical protein
MEIKKNKSFAENIVYNYLHNLPNGEDLIQEGYKLAIENYEVRMFRNIYERSKINPDKEVLNLIRKIYVDTGKEKFLDLLVDFE